MFKYFFEMFLKYTLPTMIITYIIYKFFGYVGILMFVLSIFLYSIYYSKKLKTKNKEEK